MIRTNLSTRPFYNEHIVNLTLLVAAIAVVAASVFNVARIVQYSRSDTSLGLQASQDEARARDLRVAAAKLRSSVDSKQIELASNEARIANELIDRRTFSWTELFNRFEATLPPDARITSVRPKIDRDGRIALTVNVVARTVGDLNEFMNKLDETRVFQSVRPSEEHVNDQGLLDATLDAVYMPPIAPPKDTRSAGKQQEGR